VFAEEDESAVVINIDGHSVFGLKGVEEQLKKIKAEYDNSIDCTTQLNGPNYLSAFIGNILYTALPIYLSAGIVVAGMMAIGGFSQSSMFNVFLYATLGVIGAKTRFWVNQRRKQRPVWLSILILLLIAPVICGLIVLFFWGVDQLS
jgi:Na+/phosphate symporter